MPFTRDNTILMGQNQDTVKQAITKLDDDMTKIYTHANTVNTLTSQKISQTEKNASNGVCPLDTNSKVPVVNIPSIVTSPVGSVTMFGGETCPDGWLVCNGAEYPITTYPKLFEAIGYLWGGLGSNFKVPDMRGYFPRGWDNGAGVDLDRLTRDGGDHVGSSQPDQVGPHTHGVDQWSESASSGNESRFGSGGSNHSSANVWNLATTESRPKNKYFLFIIKKD